MATNGTDAIKFANQCLSCKFAGKTALRNWLDGRPTPYCTYPNERDIDFDGICHSFRLDIKVKGEK